MVRKWVVVIILSFIIVSVLAYLFYLSNNVSVYDIDKKFNIHGNVIDYGTYKEGDSGWLMDKINRIYTEYSKKGEKVYFVFGNEEDITLSTYEEINRGNINLLIGKTSQQFILEEEKYMSKKIIPENNKVNIIVNNKEYKFNLKMGESVFFIITEEE